MLRSFSGTHPVCCIILSRSSSARTYLDGTSHCSRALKASNCRMVPMVGTMRPVETWTFGENVVHCGHAKWIAGTVIKWLEAFKALRRLAYRLRACIARECRDERALTLIHSVSIGACPHTVYEALPQRVEEDEGPALTGGREGQSEGPRGPPSDLGSFCPSRKV